MQSRKYGMRHYEVSISDPLSLHKWTGWLPIGASDTITIVDRNLSRNGLWTDYERTINGLQSSTTTSHVIIPLRRSLNQYSWTWMQAQTIKTEIYDGLRDMNANVPQLSLNCFTKVAHCTWINGMMALTLLYLGVSGAHNAPLTQRLLQNWLWASHVWVN